MTEKYYGSANNGTVKVSSAVVPQENKYYRRVSRNYGLLSIFFILLLVLFLVIALYFYGDYITYDNLGYFVRDWKAMSAVDSDFSRIDYSWDNAIEFTKFRTGIAVCNGDTLCCYDSSGICLIEDKVGFTNPRMRVSEKYLLVYDIGGKGYSVYNKFTKVISRESEDIIISADIADDGTVILVTRCGTSKFVCGVYNSAFNKMMSVFRDNYVTSSAISRDGKTFLIASAIPGGSDIDCELAFFTKGSDQEGVKHYFSDMIPLSVYSQNDRFVVISDSCVIILNNSGDIIKTVSLAGTTLSRADVSDSKIVIVGALNSLGTENSVSIYDLDGNLILNKIINDRIYGAYASPENADAAAYIRTSDSAVRINSDGGTDYILATDEDIISIIPLREGAIVAYRSGAESKWK